MGTSVKSGTLFCTVTIAVFNESMKRTGHMTPYNIRSYSLVVQMDIASEFLRLNRVIQLSRCQKMCHAWRTTPTAS